MQTCDFSLCYTFPFHQVPILAFSLGGISVIFFILDVNLFGE